MSLLPHKHAVFRSCLYVPGNQPDRIARAYASGADAVILDLEDAVPAPQKAAARDIVAAITAAPVPKPTYVRVNSAESGLCDADVRAVAGEGLAGVRLAKAGSPDDVRRAAYLLRQAGSAAVVHVLIESAAALENAYALATASPSVGMLGLGESDLRADLGAAPESPTMDAARARVIVASRAAGLPSPCQSVYPEPRDPHGLLVTSRHGRGLGFIGRMAIHPAQIPIIHDVYTPTPDEIDDARSICEAARIAAEADRSIVITPSGRMVGPPAVARAKQVLQLARTLNLIEIA
ncbi:putative citrate lyase beta chain [Actinacidiphila reveromycinica]|uniref:Putative citrate lyase beta chain n=1 Tax=Actinacidiphila reveromycinica TaxID=659352 RepID=A0A7U3URC5_9ACTN|nr:CoA ester lyase [Streptomyces sp. SN-593]BBA97278.1 putative citrate lyase beta chain [Streptomyces sp. SN-593]